MSIKKRMSKSSKVEENAVNELLISTSSNDKLDDALLTDFTDNFYTNDNTNHTNSPNTWNYLKINNDMVDTDIVPVFNDIDPLAEGLNYFNSDYYKNEKLSNNMNSNQSNSLSFSNSLDLILNDPLKSAKDKRRERNKVFARKTRIKRKMELEDLRDKVCGLKMENDALKGILGSKLPSNIGNELIMKCSIQLPDNVDSFVCHLISRIKDGEIKLIDALLKLQKSFCICSAVAPDCPIVYASPGFCYLTGYDVLQVLGKNCRFLQGPETDQVEVAKLRQAICNYQECQVILKNYRRDGSEFWNYIQIAPLKDLQGLMTLIVGVQVEVENPPNELKHLRVINKLNSNFNTYYDDIQPIPVTIKEEYRVPTNHDLNGYQNSEGSSTTAETGLNSSDTSSASDY